MFKGAMWGPLTGLLLVSFFVDAWFIAKAAAGSAQFYWIVTIILILVICITAGKLVNDRIDGILVSDRNRLSLGRLQWTAWLILIMSAYFVAAIWNAGHGGNMPAIPEQLLGLLGIVSGSSVVGSVISNSKKQTDAPSAPGATGLKATAANDKSATNAGQLDANKSSADASWADLYLGDDVGNRYVVDISRLQKLLITIILMAVYAGWLWKMLADAGPYALPGLDEKQTFLWLLGISHASYLAIKATPKPVPGG